MLDLDNINENKSNKMVSNKPLQGVTYTLLPCDCTAGSDGVFLGTRWLQRVALHQYLKRRSIKWITIAFYNILEF